MHRKERLKIKRYIERHDEFHKQNFRRNMVKNLNGYHRPDEMTKRIKISLDVKQSPRGEREAPNKGPGMSNWVGALLWHTAYPPLSTQSSRPPNLRGEGPDYAEGEAPNDHP